MLKSTTVAVYTSDIRKVWHMVTDNTNSTWRSDLVRTDVLSDTSFFGHSPKGLRSTYRIICKIPYEKYVYSIDNNSFSGSWSGLFSVTESGGTRIEITESRKFKNPVMAIISYIGNGILFQKAQEIYAYDLRQALGEHNIQP